MARTFYIHNIMRKIFLIEKTTGERIDITEGPAVHKEVYLLADAQYRVWQWTYPGSHLEVTGYYDISIEDNLEEFRKIFPQDGFYEKEFPSGNTVQIEARKGLLAVVDYTKDPQWLWPSAHLEHMPEMMQPGWRFLHHIFR